MVDSAGLPPDLDISEDEDLTKSRLDRAFGWIATKIRGLESFTPSWVKEVETLRAFGLARINEAIMPAYQRVMNLASFGFLRADSGTRAAFAVGSRYVVVIAEGPQRALFTPTAFVTITRVSTPDDWAICRVDSYDAESGRLTVEVVGAQVSKGEHDDWQITATAGSVTAAVALLADTRAARDAALQLRADTTALRDAAVVAKNAAEKAAKDANTAALLIEGGQVASVNNRTGNVKLSEADIPGLTARLDSMAVNVTVIEALALKADKTAVENSLKLKADKTAVEQSLATKAGSEATADALNDRYTKAVSDDRFVRWTAPGSGRAVISYLQFPDHQWNGDGRWLVYYAGSMRIRGLGDNDLVKIEDNGNIHGGMWATGHLHGHIEKRCNDYREDLRGWVSGNFINDLRLTGGGDTGCRAGWVGGNSGEVQTGMAWSSSIYRGVDAVRTRYVQKLIAGNWYTIGTW